MHTNRLANEKSPYLQQHVHNPVDWYPWGEEAFERARREDKPIFLSIGYSTCHWCHVMERESFESESLAEVLNRFFIQIKVDREERPDVDRVYMTFVQATTGGGGWPMSVWLTPELKPFLGGTYFPTDDRYGRPGFRSVLEQIAKAWESDRPRILQSSHDVLAELEKHVQVKGDAAYLDDRILESGFNVFRRTYDVRLGGFGNAPKFPRPAVFNFLLRYYRRTGNQEALQMTVNTLKAMARGGMYDHLGGGFHRYSVDARWFVPHFEKMLYDQAQLAISYLEAFQITGDDRLQETARGILDYVLRDMRSPEGGFYSAEDADSVIDPAQPDEKGEGAFYIWSADEIRSLVDSPVFDWFQYRYGVEAAGNVQEDPQGEFSGRNILYEARTVEETAERFHLTEAEIRRGLEEAKQKLFAHRSGRIHPHLDDKILTCWNGLMISAFAKAGQVLGESKYSEAAATAADFILSKLYEPSSGRLLRRFREGEAAIQGFLDDYAFLAQGLLDLYETTFDIHHLDTAIRLTETMCDHFEDREMGGFFSTAEGQESLVLRIKDDYDGAEPSGNSIAILNLLRLAQMTDRVRFREAAERALIAFGPRLASAPVALPQMVAAFAFSRSKPKQVIIAGEEKKKSTREMIAAVHRHFSPERIVLLAGNEESRQFLSRLLPVVKDMAPLNGQATAYVCENYACQMPTADVQQLTELLQ